MYTTGDKLLNVMKEEEIGIAELARISGVPERTILDIMAGVKEPELGVIIETTKTDAGTRVLPITEDLAQNRCFRQSSRIEIHRKWRKL